MTERKMIFLKKTKPPRDIVRCKFCNSIMDIEDKDFWHWFDWKPDRVSFLYRCKKCNKWRVFYNNWGELQKEKEYCEKCWNIINYTAKFNWNMLIKNYKCNSCWNSYVSTKDYSSSYTEKETITENDIQMYWYNEKEAKWMKDSYDSINRLKFIMDEIKEKQQQEDYSKEISNLVKYNLFQLEEFINKSLEKTEFMNFKIINKEQVKTYMKCDFEVYFTWNFWENTSKIFDKLVEKLLANSNWKLQKNKTHEKLWVLSWVLFWYDNKNDLIELVKKSK